jgi:hypothetical protein
MIRSLRIITVTILVLIPHSVTGCSCIPLDVPAALRSADSVFRGRVTQIKWLKQVGDPLFGERRTIVTFRVSGVYKGQVASTAQLHTQENRTSCAGFNFLSGHEYIVYAYAYTANQWHSDSASSSSPSIRSSEKFLGTSICSRTNEVVNALQDLRELGRPHHPDPA